MITDVEPMDQAVAISEDEASRLWRITIEAAERALTDEERNFVVLMVHKTGAFRAWRARRSFR